jgi:hypothetical protein
MGKKINFLLAIPKKINNEWIQGGEEGRKYRENIRSIRKTENAINEFEKNLIAQANAQEKFDNIQSTKNLIDAKIDNDQRNRLNNAIDNRIGAETRISDMMTDRMNLAVIDKQISKLNKEIEKFYTVKSNQKTIAKEMEKSGNQNKNPEEILIPGTKTTQREKLDALDNLMKLKDDLITKYENRLPQQIRDYLYIGRQIYANRQAEALTKISYDAKHTKSNIFGGEKITLSIQGKGKNDTHEYKVTYDKKTRDITLENTLRNKNDSYEKKIVTEKIKDKNNKIIDNPEYIAIQNIRNGTSRTFEITPVNIQRQIASLHPTNQRISGSQVSQAIKSEISGNSITEKINSSKIGQKGFEAQNKVNKVLEKGNKIFEKAHENKVVSKIFGQYDPNKPLFKINNGKTLNSFQQALNDHKNANQTIRQIREEANSGKPISKFERIANIINEKTGREIFKTNDIDKLNRISKKTEIWKKIVESKTQESKKSLQKIAQKSGTDIEGKNAKDSLAKIKGQVNTKRSEMENYESNNKWRVGINNVAKVAGVGGAIAGLASGGGGIAVAPAVGAAAFLSRAASDGMKNAASDIKPAAQNFAKQAAGLALTAWNKIVDATQFATNKTTGSNKDFSAAKAEQTAKNLLNPEQKRATNLDSKLDKLEKSGKNTNAPNTTLSSYKTKNDAKINSALNKISNSFKGTTVEQVDITPKSPSAGGSTPTNEHTR